MSEIRHIVFDLGQVLIRWDPERPYRRLIPDETARRKFLSEVCTPAWNLEQDRGRSWPDAEAALIAEHPEEAELIRAFRQNWNEMVPDAIPGTAAIVDALVDGGADVTALTNFAADTYLVAESRFPVFRRFRGVTVSGRVGLVKPDPAIYRHHAAAFGLDPARTLFFDDSAANVDAARAVGWNAELFTGAERMRQDLARYGVAA
jgi:HAD superfamily hydrolase (TIGR01509 family)